MLLVPPGPPTDLQVTFRNASSILIKWNPPMITNGQITSYRVSLNNSIVSRFVVERVFPDYLIFVR